jgi:cyanophycin synthetase
MHLAPSQGIGRNVAEYVVNMLFPPGRPFRIPIFAVTGTNGKTTTTRFIAHILRGSGCVVGFTTTDGTYIQNNQITAGDNTGPVSAQLVLKDPSVQVAVLETARGGIIRSGLGYDHCDVAVVLNVAADHLGLKMSTLWKIWRASKPSCRARFRRRVSRF